MVRDIQIEAWALDVIDRAVTNKPCEDSRVELKAEWPDPVKAARRIAGHANAARGSEILWLIGINEKMGTIHGANPKDLANWLPMTMSEFDGIPPSCHDVIISPKDSGGPVVVALVFDTDRAPYVIRNPKRGTPSGGNVDYEVPWREGTRVRTASRAELIKLLAPFTRLPLLEALSGSISVTPTHSAQNAEYPSARYTYKIILKLYVTPQSNDNITIASHRVHCSVDIDGLGVLHYQTSQVSTGYHIITQSEQVTLSSPSPIWIRGTVGIDAYPTGMPMQIEATVDIYPAGTDRPASISMELIQKTSGMQGPIWVYDEPKHNALMPKYTG